MLVLQYLGRRKDVLMVGSVVFYGIDSSYTKVMNHFIHSMLILNNIVWKNIKPSTFSDSVFYLISWSCTSCYCSVLTLT